MRRNAAHDAGRPGIAPDNFPKSLASHAAAGLFALAACGSPAESLADETLLLFSGTDVWALRRTLINGRRTLTRSGSARSDEAWQRDTLSIIWSTTKALATLCVQILFDRGQLDLDAPVARYWPEFAAAGKDRVRVRHILSHTTGVLAPVEMDKIAKRLAVHDLFVDRHRHTENLGFLDAPFGLAVAARHIFEQLAARCHHSRQQHILERVERGLKLHFQPLGPPAQRRHHPVSQLIRMIVHGDVAFSASWPSSCMQPQYTSMR